VIRDNDYDVDIGSGYSDNLLEVLDNDDSGKGDLTITRCGSCTGDFNQEDFGFRRLSHENCRIAKQGGAVRYRPNENDEGLRRCTYEACDECGVCGEAYIFLCVGESITSLSSQWYFGYNSCSLTTCTFTDTYCRWGLPHAQAYQQSYY
jgi:hypothetical protein